MAVDTTLTRTLARARGFSMRISLPPGSSRWKEDCRTVAKRPSGS
jgi:hypothetical protein